VIGTGAETQTAPAAITNQQREDAKAMLVSGPWKFTGIGWGAVCTFTKDGGFAIEGEFGPGGTWSIADNVVSIAYDGRAEVLALPLNPKGTNGKDPNGRPFTAVLQSTANAPAAGGPATAGAATDTASVEAQLEAVPWRFLGTWWYAVRVLAKDGTFTTKGNGESGTWAVANNSVVLTFPDGHKDSFALPLNPNGMHGADKEGNPVLITAGKPDPAPASAHPHSDLDFLKQTPTPGPADIARENAGSIATLVSGPWKFTGRSWTVVRIFAKDGTFTSVNQPKEYGTWKIVGAKINLVYQDGHIDTLSLPLDPKGTDAADRVGIPVLAVLQDTSGAAPTPAPTAAPVASNPAPFGNTAPAATPAPRPQGPTPPPFGTTLPPAQ
ncbi:MAG TPA: hypothetical protein VHI52_11385, partial [Verrucomicrobiae bacterium]|nr:hypothetical protein [Verrucomicrobiae bacterium]